MTARASTARRYQLAILEGDWLDSLGVAVLSPEMGPIESDTCLNVHKIRSEARGEGSLDLNGIDASCINDFAVVSERKALVARDSVDFGKHYRLAVRRSRITAASCVTSSLTTIIPLPAITSLTIVVSAIGTITLPVPIVLVSTTLWIILRKVAVICPISSTLIGTVVDIILWNVAIDDIAICKTGRSTKKPAKLPRLYGKGTSRS
ncbi:hypothetical protein FOC4_g10000828 [Fusarium odoratissimum]|uniref:Uncharacterized protein n=1 Tax=Fusarium oxysporum f. sp. cubense (strain race 4) TaxID=2502994 RepID=N1S3M5_FUSC4|nr:hypothetical protein FOC4_g10000820 [Fusarium odoratissimum]EMT73469.1 hypothetical protein FOC4_g10000828 [Fusarium odoratissimum]